MSAYLHRLTQRFAPPTSDGGAPEAIPFVRSRSPIAANDQLGQFGFGESYDLGSSDSLGDPAQPQIAASATSPAAVHVQRKTMGTAPAAPRSPSPSPAPPVAEARPAPALPGVLAPTKHDLGRPVAVGSPARESRDRPVDHTARHEHGVPASPSPVREPMDPGELFAPFPRFFDDQPSHGDTPTVDARSPVTHQPAALPRPRVVELPPLVAPRAEAVLAPWARYEARAPMQPGQPGVAPLELPSLEPRPASPSVPQPRALPLLIAPKVADPRPFIPDPGEVARASSPTLPRVSIGRVEIEVVPAQANAPAQAAVPTRNAKGKLDIESISQIGPLARHFPNRRRLRLRYR